MRRIVVIGTGFAGLHIAQELASEISNRRGLRLTVVTDQAHFLFTPLWSEVAAGSSKLPAVALDLPRILSSKIELIIGRVEEIALDDKVVRTGDREIAYDFLVVAPGATTDWGGHPEFEHHALPCRSGRDAVDAHDAVDRAFAQAAAADDGLERRRLLTFVIVGGGPCGVELAAQLASRVDQEAGKGLDASLAALVRIVIVERGETLLPDHEQEMRRCATEHLENAGVELRLAEAVIGCSATRVELAGHDALACGTIFWCGGVRAPAWLEASGFQVDERGSVLVRRTLQAVGFHGVYCAGDIASTDAPRTADVAVNQAATVARNILADLSGRSRREWTHEPASTFLSLGRTNAVASVRGVVLVGRPAQALWGAMSTRLLPPGLKGLRLLPELFAGAFASRTPNSNPLLTE